MDDFDPKSIFYEAKLLVKKLLIKCPKKTPLSNCPLSGLRELSLIEKLETVDKMPLDHLENILLHHKNCQLETE